MVQMTRDVFEGDQSGKCFIVDETSIHPFDHASINTSSQLSHI